MQDSTHLFFVHPDRREIEHTSTTLHTPPSVPPSVTLRVQIETKWQKQAAVSQRGHFRECEVEVLLYGVKTRKHILFGSLSSSQKKVVGGAECGSGYKCSEL